jgi:DNA-binding beta-propeller fold protein YncE
LLSLSFSLLTLVIFVIAITFLATISTVSIVYAPVVEEEADNVGPPTQSSASPSSPSPSPSLPVTPNASAANTSSFFIREWGGSCLVSSNTNCVDPDGPTGNLSVGNGQFWGIWGVAANSSNVFVADVLNNRVQKFDLNGTFIRSWGSFCDLSTGQGCLDPDGPAGNLSLGDGQFNMPSGIGVDSKYVFVVDHNNQTQKFDYDGNFIKRWGSSGSADGQFKTPEGIAVDKNSASVYVADSGNHRIQKFDKEGQHLKTWGSFCEVATAKECVDPDGPAGNLSLGDGQFNYPQGVAIDSNASNNIYVADSKNNRIQKFDDNGTFIKKWGSVGNGVGEFRRPADVAVDSSIVYVVDAENDRIQEFNSNGTFIKSWGSECLRRFDRPMSSGCTDMDGPLGNLTTGQGQFNRPAGIAIASGVVIIADNSNDLIQTFKTSTAPAAFSTVDKLERHARQ